MIIQFWKLLATRMTKRSLAFHIGYWSSPNSSQNTSPYFLQYVSNEYHTFLAQFLAIILSRLSQILKTLLPRIQFHLNSYFIQQAFQQNGIGTLDLKPATSKPPVFLNWGRVCPICLLSFIRLSTYPAQWPNFFCWLNLAFWGVLRLAVPWNFCCDTAKWPFSPASSTLMLLIIATLGGCPDFPHLCLYSVVPHLHLMASSWLDGGVA